MIEDIKYPIYRFSARWSQDGKQNLEYPIWHKGLSEGRVWNSTSFYKMYKVEPVNMEFELNLWWDNLNKKKFVNIQNLTLEQKLYRIETWCLTWFEHWTFDVGQTNEEALDSFMRYVDRTTIDNKKHGKIINGRWEEPYCLMGAEDRWRWCGAEPNGERNDRSNPPCRCRFCKERGIIRIGH